MKNWWSTGRLLRFAFALLTLWGTPHAIQAQKPNVLMITADDLGIQLGCYGDKAARTPVLDELASRGCLFENAYVAQASCSPSRSAMFTGLYPHANGQYGLLNAGVGFALTEQAQAQTIPQVLKQEGYSTGIIGKLHVGVESKFPFDERMRADTRDVRSVAEQVGAFFEKTASPFFLMANFSDPHVMKSRPGFPDEVFPNQYQGVPADPLQIGQVPPLPFQRLNHPQQIARTTQFYNAASRFDYGVGLLLERLAAAGHADDTLIILVGDHGPPFFRGKTSCYEGGVHVPMIVVWPQVTEPGLRSKALVSTVDILPTILDAVGSQHQILQHGQSLRGAVRNDEFRDYLATEFHYHGSRPFYPRRSIRDMRFKLIHNLRSGEEQPGSTIDGDAALRLARESQSMDPQVLSAYERSAAPPEFELFDLTQDPWEFTNLAGLDEYRQDLQRMQAALMQWRKTTDDPLLTDAGWSEVGKYQHKTPDR